MEYIIIDTVSKSLQGAGKNAILCQYLASANGKGRSVKKVMSLAPTILNDYPGLLQTLEYTKIINKSVEID